MNAYEIMLMIEPEVAEERHTEIIERTKATITERGGAWGSVEPWGKRKLAYEIDHMTDAWYYVLTFDANPRRCTRSPACLRSPTASCGTWRSPARSTRIDRRRRAEPEPAESTA